MCTIDKIQLSTEPDEISIVAGGCMNPAGTEVYWIDYDVFPYELKFTNTTTKVDTLFATGDSTPGEYLGKLEYSSGIESGPDGSIYSLEYDGNVVASYVVKYEEGGVSYSDSIQLPNTAGWGPQTANNTYNKMAYIPRLGKLVVPKWEFEDFPGDGGRIQVYLVDLALSSYELIYESTMVAASASRRNLSIVRSSGAAFWIVASDFDYTEISYYDGGIVDTIVSTGPNRLIATFTAWSPCDGSYVVVEKLESDLFADKLFKVYRDLTTEEILDGDPCYIINGYALNSHSLSVRGIGNGHVFTFSLTDFGDTHGALARWLTFLCYRPKPLRQLQRDDRHNAPRASKLSNNPTSRQHSLRATSINSYW